MSHFTFSPSAGRYRDASTGRFVPEATVRSGVDALVQHSAERIGDLAQQLRAGQIAVSTFQAELLAEIKALHVAAALAAYGGREAMDPSKYGYVGSQVKAQYQYARQFVGDIIDGKQPDGRMVARARSYASAARITYESVRAREAVRLGMAEARNMLRARESCSECLALAARGWIPADEMPTVGARACGPHCRCTVSWRRGSISEAA